MCTGFCESARAALQLTTAGSPHTHPLEQVGVIYPKPADDKLPRAVERLTYCNQLETRSAAAKRRTQLPCSAFGLQV